MPPVRNLRSSKYGNDRHFGIHFSLTMKETAKQPPYEGISRKPARPAAASEGLLIRLAVLVIIVVTVLAFAPVVRNDFVNWDDDYVLVDNDEYRGLSRQHLKWMFTTGFAGHYHPLTWLSFAIDAQFWGVEPAGFHLTNLLLHVVTSVGFFFVAKRLLIAGARGLKPTVQGGNDAGPRGLKPAARYVLGALFAALVFAVHPLRVESVAWATERRDVLSGVWLMLTMISYLRMVDASKTSTRRAMLAVALVSYTLSLLSKAGGVILPVALLMVDVYPLRRLRQATVPDDRGLLRRVLLEKLWFLIPAVFVGSLALWAQGQAGALRTFEEHPLGLRIGQAFYGIVFYLWKSIWPAGLIPLHEQDPQAAALDVANVLSAGLVIALTILFWFLRRRQPGLLAAWGAYVVFLLPVLGLAQSGPQVVADRYSYLSCMPWAILAGGALSWLWERASAREKVLRPLLSVAAIAVVGVLAMLTRSQTRVWTNSYTLWTTVLEHAPDTGTAHANLAAWLNRRGDFETARTHSLEALQILPGNRTAHIALARSSAELGDLATAEAHYETALRIRPDDLGRMLDLASVKGRLGKDDEAEALYRRLIDVDRRSAVGYHNLAAFLASLDRPEEARAMFEQAVRLAPSDPLTRFRLAVVLLTLKEPAGAIDALEQGVRHTPENPLLNAKLAWVLATCADDALRDGPRALELATRAVDSGEGIEPLAQEALAAAQGETGDFAGAVATLTALLADDSVALSQTMRERLELQLAHYQQGQPFRE